MTSVTIQHDFPLHLEMGWGLTIVIALLTSAAGAGAAGLLASLCVDWFRIGSREGGSGYFIAAIGLLGIFGGLIIGAVTARLMAGGFFVALGSAVGVVVGICVVIGVVARFFGEVPPTLRGDELMLEVELKMPPGWTSDHKSEAPGGRSCWLQAMARRQGGDEASLGGTAELTGDIAHCSVQLFTSRRNRHVRVMLGNKTDVSFLLPLPGKPVEENLQWSVWSNQYFSHELGKPEVKDYQFRCRVQRMSEVLDRANAAAAALSKAHEAEIAAIPADAPIEQWLPFFEAGTTGVPTTGGEGGWNTKVFETVRVRMPELARPLRSKDSVAARRAVFATAMIANPPAELIEPLAEAGKHIVPLIRAARAAARPDDPDIVAEQCVSTFFFKWSASMEMAGPAAWPKWRAVLVEIEPVANESKTGDIEGIARCAREYIKKIDAPAGS